jgi:integrase
LSTTRHKRGTGNVRKLPSGRYQIRYTDPNGIRRNGSRTFPTKAMAELELARIQSAIDAGTWSEMIEIESPRAYVDGKKITLREVADQWRELRLNKRGQPLSPNTLNEYKRLIEKVLVSVVDKPVRSITERDIEEWWISPDQRNSPNQASKAYSHLKTLMTYAAKKHWILVNPCDIVGASNYTPEREEIIPTVKQVEIMLEVAPEPYRAIIALAAWGGLRKGEILELRRKDIDFLKTEAETWILVNIDRAVIWQGVVAQVRPPKTVGSIRVVQLPQRVNEIITSHLRSVPIDPEALLFPANSSSNSHFSKHQLGRSWYRIRAQAGYPARFHSLRAFSATEFGKTGATPKEIMDRFGHRDINTAMRYQRSTGRDAELLRRIG